MERDSFVFYRSFKNAVCALPESMQLQMFLTILDYALDGKEPPPDGVERAILELIRPQLEANNKRYENGKKGGAPKGNKNAAKGKNNQNQPKNNPAEKSKQPQNNPPEKTGEKSKQPTEKMPNIPPTGESGEKTTENNQKQPNVNVNVNANANYNDTTVVVSNAREAFCKAYAVTDDDTTISGIDFAALSNAYSASAKFLQKHCVARRMSWVVKHYAEIIAGKYTDFAEHKAPPPTAQAQNSFHVEDD